MSEVAVTAVPTRHYLVTAVTAVTALTVVEKVVVKHMALGKLKRKEARALPFHVFKNAGMCR